MKISLQALAVDTFHPHDCFDFLKENNMSIPVGLEDNLLCAIPSTGTYSVKPVYTYIIICLL